MPTDSPPTMPTDSPPTVPTEAPPKTHCPTCGAKLHRSDLSMCAYCAAPLQLGGRIEHATDETAKRLLRLREHAAFAAATQWTPRDAEVEAHTRRRRRIGLAFVALGLTVAAAAAIRLAVGDERLVLQLAAVAGSFTAIAGAILMLRAASERARSRSLPLLRRPALAVSRRSLTTEQRGASATTYYFLLHFDDGSEGEFRWPGQGTMYEPMPNGTTGIAYTRGDRLLDFRKL